MVLVSVFCAQLWSNLSFKITARTGNPGLRGVYGVLVQLSTALDFLVVLKFDLCLRFSRTTTGTFSLFQKIITSRNEIPASKEPASLSVCTATPSAKFPPYPLMTQSRLPKPTQPRHASRLFLSPRLHYLPLLQSGPRCHCAMPNSIRLLVL
jgi:hypothetical protein